jgi:hypothetical protein
VQKLVAKSGSCLPPVSHLAEGEKSADNELIFLVLQLNKERVRHEAGLGAEGEPLAPGTVRDLARLFLL